MSSPIFSQSTLAAFAPTLVLFACASNAGEANQSRGLNEPPTGSASEMAEWIRGGTYLGWACEDAPHAPRAPSPHPRNRICSNPALSAAANDAALPVGVATVKEIFNATGDEPVAYAVIVKVAEGGAADPAAYYYFEGDLTSAPAAEGTGDSGGVAQTVCYECHSHGPDADGREQLFTIVR
jgi:hypothetical protein